MPADDSIGAALSLRASPSCKIPKRWLPFDLRCQKGGGTHASCYSLNFGLEPRILCGRQTKEPRSFLCAKFRGLSLLRSSSEHFISYCRATLSNRQLFRLRLSGLRQKIAMFSAGMDNTCLKLCFAACQLSMQCEYLDFSSIMSSAM